MILSWIVAGAYAAMYTIAILITKFKATERLSNFRERQKSMKKGLIQHQQNISSNQGTLTQSPETNKTPPKPPKRKTSDTSADLTQLHQQLHTSVPYGAPISNYECFLAILHSIDAGMCVTPH